jgi:AraC-like DNA-binding protein
MLITFGEFLFNAFEIYKFYSGAVIGYYLVIPLMLCNAPILYLYVRVLTIPNFRFNYKYLFHFVPALIVLFVNLYSYGNISYDVKLNIIMQKSLNLSSSDHFFLDIFTKTYFFSSEIFYNVQVVFYSFLMIIRLYWHRKNIFKYFSYTENISLNWLIVFIIANVIFSLYEVFFYEYSASVYLIIINIYFLFLGLFGVKQTDIYIGRLKFSNDNIKPDFGITKDIAEKEYKSENLKGSENTDSYPRNIEFDEVESKNKIPKELMDSYVNSLVEIMETEKPFLNSTLNLPDLADMLKIHRNTLSFVINETYNKNFFNYINEYRIKEAQLRLLDSSYDNLSIEGLAKGVGFNSKSVFNPAFKRFTGKTPAEYKKTQR